MQVQELKTYGDYEIICTLGEGNFGKVKLARKDQTYVAIKLSRKAPQQLLAQNNQLLLRQISILKQLHHPNLLHYIDSHADWKYKNSNGEQSSRLGLIMEYLPSNELMEILEGGPLGSNLCRYYFKQLINGLEYLHNNSVIHRDLKPQNILFDTGFNLKITDFGLATIVDKTQPTTNCGTANYKSPQMLLKVPYNGILNDLFGAGIILFNMMTAKSPFDIANPMSGLYRWIATNEHDRFWTFFEKLMPFDSDFKDLINSMLSIDPTERPTIAEIKHHPWYIKQESNISLMNQVEEFKKKIDTITKKKSELRIKKLRQKKENKTTNPLFPNGFRNFQMEVETPKPIFTKKSYERLAAKSTDILVETIKDTKGFLKLLTQISSDVRVLPGGKFEIQVEKVFEAEKFVGVLSVLEVDERIDCLRLKAISGNIGFYYEYLKELNMLFQEE